MRVIICNCMIPCKAVGQIRTKSLRNTKNCKDFFMPKARVNWPELHNFIVHNNVEVRLCLIGPGVLIDRDATRYEL